MEDSIHIKARRILESYLEENKLRKTPERYAILDAIYQMKGVFTLKELSRLLAEDNFRVSRATLYNNIRFFQKLRLVVRHTFMEGTKYSAGLVKQNLCHQICTVCGEVKEIQIPAVMRAVSEARYKRFHQDTYALYVYGMCSSCQAKQTRKKLQSYKSDIRKTKA